MFPSTKRVGSRDRPTAVHKPMHPTTCFLDLIPYKATQAPEQRPIAARDTELRGHAGVLSSHRRSHVPARSTAITELSQLTPATAASAPSSASRSVTAPPAPSPGQRPASPTQVKSPESGPANICACSALPVTGHRGVSGPPAALEASSRGREGSRHLPPATPHPPTGARASRRHMCAGTSVDDGTHL